MGKSFSLEGLSIPFETSDTVATAALRAGVHSFGLSQSGGQLGVFCGIGQCQACLIVNHQGQVVEACLTPCVEGAAFSHVMGSGGSHV
jgi:aerobic-type carbon monoxide dehydrogenase small subunit (CoxS/CutS family)